MSSMVTGDRDVRRLRLRSAGMFSNVNEVVEHLRLAREGKYRFVVDWRDSAYRDPARPGNPWRYYFEPCFPGAVLPETPQDLPRGGPVACTRDNIITPRLRDGDSDPLLLPRDRRGAHELIRAGIRLRPPVRQRIERFRSRHLHGPVIGLHVRGAGRTGGGVPGLRARYGDLNGVPLDIFCAATDAALADRPDARILACSDSSDVIAALAVRYGSRLVTYGATRSAFGEMHAHHPRNEGLTFPAHKLGMDVLVEAYLLAGTDFLIHGNSNVTNFVLCLSPDLDHRYLEA